MTPQEIYEHLKKSHDTAVLELVDLPQTDPFIKVESSAVFDICHSLRDDEGLEFDYMMSLSATDLAEQLGVVYHLYAMKYRHKIVIKTEVPKDNPLVPSVERLWRTADWHEREAFDLIGVVFEGHHNMIRILLPYDWEGHPLRKDYQAPETYHGMKVS